MIADDVLELVSVLNSELLKSSSWDAFLPLVQKRLGADCAGFDIHCGDVQPRQRKLHVAGTPSSEVISARYASSFSGQDPLDDVRLDMERVYNCGELLEAMPYKDREQFRRFLKELGWNFLRVLRVRDSFGSVAWLTAARQHCDFSARADEVLRLLTPHIAIALRNFRSFERERIRAIISSDAIHRMDFEWLLLDSGGKVVDQSPAANHFLDKVRVLRVAVDGELTTTSPRKDALLARAIRTIATNSQSPPQDIHISEDPWINVLLMRLQGGVQTGATTPVMIAFLQGDGGTSERRMRQLVRLFNLTKSEAKIAILLSRGKSIVEASRELGLTISTGRTYTKRIYAKTGVPGQAGLVKLVLGNVVAFA